MALKGDAIVQRSVSAVLAIFAVSAFAALRPACAEAGRAGDDGAVLIGSVANTAPGNLSGVVVRVHRSAAGSGYFWFAHAVTLRTDDGNREAYVTSLDAAHDPLPQVGDRCDAQYRAVQTSAGPGLFIDRIWCNGREIALAQ